MLRIAVIIAVQHKSALFFNWPAKHQRDVSGIVHIDIQIRTQTRKIVVL